MAQDGTARAELTAKQQRFLACLLVESSIEAACKSAGVPHSTAHRFLKDLVFSAAYRAARHAAVDQAIGILQQSAGKAVRVLCAVADDRKAPAGARVAAASKILELSMKAIELDEITARLEALETQLGEAPGGEAHANGRSRAWRI